MPRIYSSKALRFSRSSRINSIGLISMGSSVELLDFHQLNLFRPDCKVIWAQEKPVVRKSAINPTRQCRATETTSGVDLSPASQE
jgi:hypothetical protein